MYVGRGTPYGNQFADGDRYDNVERFSNWWYADWNMSLRLQAIRELKGRDLVCSCAPLECHADVILEYLECVAP